MAGMQADVASSLRQVTLPGKSDVQRLDRDFTVSSPARRRRIDLPDGQNQANSNAKSPARPPHRLGTFTRAKRNLLKRFNLIWVVQSPAQKQFASSSPQINGFLVTIPARTGAYRDRHERWSGMRWTREQRKTSAVRADGEVVWSRRSDAGVKVAESSANDGGNQAWSPGRSRISRKITAQGRPDDPPVPVVLPRAFCCTRTMGAVGTRPSLRPHD
jgi:hypothetical protein